ncbi:hypothetical protein OG792_21415 [Micromonospora sp. NBC_01699]|uniref:hypothetical protein n=1 Tax=Micromonospora sp. NBC_01699 TaxID=2975984 RepID=UPI002E2CD4E9|nr:hypothetical protein [Micromonospora sp. NBC_01699]
MVSRTGAATSWRAGRRRWAGDRSGTGPVIGDRPGAGPGMAAEAGVSWRGPADGA